MSHLTTHVLDTANGIPAKGIHITLQCMADSGEWEDKASGVTNEDGRVSELVPEGEILDLGIYRLIFESGSYYHDMGIETFYPYVPVIFEIRDQSHYHVPLLLSPFGYSTYRGS